MITANEAIKIQNNEFENRKIEFEKIADAAILETFQKWKAIVEIRDQKAIDIFRNFTNLIIGHYGNNWREITREDERIGDRDNWETVPKIIITKKRNTEYNDIMIVWKWPRNPEDH